MLSSLVAFPAIVLGVVITKESKSFLRIQAIWSLLHIGQVSRAPVFFCFFHINGLAPYIINFEEATKIGRMMIIIVMRVVTQKSHRTCTGRTS